jgi:hypothetical protein
VKPYRQATSRSRWTATRDFLIWDDGKRRKASPIRFVCGCENGHLQDIDWRRVVHQNFRGDGGAGSPGRCREQMWLEDAGTSSDPRDTRIVCDCGAALSLEELFSTAPARCMSRRATLDPDKDPTTCSAPQGLRLLTRSATNTRRLHVRISVPCRRLRPDRGIEEVIHSAYRAA